MRIWTEAVRRAIFRHVARTGSPVFTRGAFFAAEEDRLRLETGTVGLTPRQTATREFQLLRNDGLLEFVRPGVYRWLGEGSGAASHGVFVLGARAERAVPPERGYVFAAAWAPYARRMGNQWIIYQGAHGYGAAAFVEAIAAEESGTGLFRARIKEGSYLEFGRIVPMVIDGRPIEHGLSASSDQLDAMKTGQPVRVISQEEFDRILELGLIEDDALLPRVDADVPMPSGVEEERQPFVPQVDRATMLVTRKVRDRQFRKRVLDAYGAKCAITGIGLLNGNDRAEVEAAHIKSVKAGGPDAVNNGNALSGTVHWMFDRGLISLSDDGDILLSRAINDVDRVARLMTLGPESMLSGRCCFASASGVSRVAPYLLLSPLSCAEPRRFIRNGANNARILSKTE